MNKIMVVQIFLISILLFNNLMYSAEWFIDKDAAGGNGISWTQAWKSFKDINWSSISPGDTLFISGGNSSKTYYETLTIEKAGNSSNFMTIKVGRESGHNGTVIIDAQRNRTNCIVPNSFTEINGNLGGNIHLKCINAIGCGIASRPNPGFIKIHYVEILDCGTPDQPGGFAHGIHLNGANGCEISFCEIHHNYVDGINIGRSMGAYGQNKIHHNHIHHNGDDGITGTSGMDIYNNIIHDQDNWDVGHPDGIQALGNYIRIYDNEIFDVVNALIFTDPHQMGIGGYIQIFNNLLYQTNPNYPYCRGIEVKAETGTNSLDDIKIFNNTIVDLTFSGIRLSCPEGPIRNVQIKNNILVNCYTGSPSGNAIAVNGGNYESDDVIIDYNLIAAGAHGVSQILWHSTIYSHEKFMSTGLGQTHGKTLTPEFVYYHERDPQNKFHLRESDLIARKNGQNLANYFKEDKAGILRTNWDLGCYEYIKPSNPPANLRFLR